MNQNKQLLDNLLKKLLGERLTRLETRSLEQTKDLNLAKKAYKLQGDLVKKYCSIKIVPPKKKGALSKDKSLTKVSTARNLRSRDKTPQPRTIRRKLSNSNLDRKQISITPDKLRSKEIKDKRSIEPKRKAITPLRYGKKNDERNDSSLPSFMKGTAANSNKNKKITKNQNYNLRVQRNGDDGERKKINNNKRNLTPEQSKIIKNKKTKQITKDQSKTNITKIKIQESNNKSTISDYNVEGENIANIKLDEELNKKDKEKENENSIGKWLSSDEGKKTSVIITSFLDNNDKYNFLSCTKKLIKNLSDILEGEYAKFLEFNKISSSSKIEDKISVVKLKYTQQQLELAPPEFQLSKGTEKAINLLNEEIYNKIFKVKELKPPLDEIVVVYRIIFQLIKVEYISSIKNDLKFWDIAGDYILNNNNGQTGQYLKDCAPKFDFSIENIYKIKKIINGNEDKLKPTVFPKICGTTGLVIFLVKDALEYCGVLTSTKKNTPCLLLKYYEYINDIEIKLKKYIQKLKSI